MTWIDIFPKTWKQPGDKWKGTQHHKSSGTWKSRPQKHTTPHLLERLLSNRQETSVGECVETREHLYSVIGYVNWYWYYEKQNEASSKTLRTELPYDPTIPLLGIQTKEMKLVY